MSLKDILFIERHFGVSIVSFGDDGDMVAIWTDVGNGHRRHTHRMNRYSRQVWALGDACNKVDMP